MNMKHAATFRLFPDRFLSLFFCADKQDVATRGGDVAHHNLQVFEHGHRLLQIDNVNAIPSAKYIRLHLRVPTAGLMSEMDSCLQQLLHRNFAHYCFSPWFYPPLSSFPLRTR